MFARMTNDGRVDSIHGDLPNFWENADGTTTCNFHCLSGDERRAFGEDWREIQDQPPVIPEGHQLGAEHIDVDPDGTVVRTWDVEPTPPAPEPAPTTAELVDALPDPTRDFAGFKAALADLLGGRA